MKIKTIDDLFDLAQGSVQLAAKLNLHQTTVIQWRKIGIPIKYWSKIMDFLKVSVEDLYRVSERALNEARNAK
jgi:hypothetical protein